MDDWADIDQLIVAGQMAEAIHEIRRYRAANLVDARRIYRERRDRLMREDDAAGR